MKEVIKKELLEILLETIEILENKEEKEIEELKELSDKSVEAVALYKDLDLISITVFVYSLYKIVNHLSPQDYQNILSELKFAKKNLSQNNLGEYNQNIKTVFSVITKCNAKIKDHLHDIMHAARIKKSAILLKKGLSIGQAAGLMGLSNWDLQQYAGQTIVLQSHQEAIPAKKRMALALKLFGF